MAKTSKKKMADDRIKVLAELQKNCNASIDEISKNVGFSRQKVWRIIKTLDSEQFTWGYHAVPDLEKINRKAYVLLVQWSHQPVENEFEAALVKRVADKTGEKLGVVVEDDLWVDGSIVDEIVVFTAPGMAQAVQFQELFRTSYTGNVVDMTLLDVVVPLKRSGFLNPSIKKEKRLL